MKLRNLRTALLPLGLMLCAGPLLAQEPNPVPQNFRNIYPDATMAQAQVDEAISMAAQQHKRILLDFGTDRCADCQVLETYLHEQPNETQISDHFLLVHIDVGPGMNLNREIAQRFGVPLAKGIPALSVVDGSGKVIHAQANGEFKNARNMSANDVTVFLNHWRG